MQYGGGQQLWDKVLDPFGLKGYHAGSTGVQMGGWFNKEITTAASVNGMKMRIPGLGGEALKKLGMTVVNLPGGEIFAALQSGAIDATEWVGPWNDLTFGFYKVAKYYYWPGMHEPGTRTRSPSMAKFDALPKDVQQIFAWACGDEHVQLTAESDASNAGALEVLIKQHNVQLKKLPDDFVKAYGGAWNEVLTELRDGGDALTKKILESYYKFQREQMAWSRIGLQEYLNARLVGFRSPETREAARRRRRGRRRRRSLHFLSSRSSTGSFSDGLLVVGWLRIWSSGEPEDGAPDGVFRMSSRTEPGCPLPVTATGSGKTILGNQVARPGAIQSTAIAAT
jgi:hypothetical protein